MARNGMFRRDVSWDGRDQPGTLPRSCSERPALLCGESLEKAPGGTVVG